MSEPIPLKDKIMEYLKMVFGNEATQIIGLIAIAIILTTMEILPLELLKIGALIFMVIFFGIVMIKLAIYEVKKVIDLLKKKEE